MLNLTKIKQSGGLMNVIETVTAANLSAYGWKMIVGTTNLNGSATIDSSEALAQIDAVFAELEEATADDVNKCVKITWTEPATGQVKLWGWKHTSTSNPTLIAQTAAASVRYIIIGK